MPRPPDPTESLCFETLNFEDQSDDFLVDEVDEILDTQQDFGTLLTVSSNNEAYKDLRSWFEGLPSEGINLHQALQANQEELQKHPKAAVRAAASLGALEALIFMDRHLGISTAKAGGAAVRAASREGHLEVLKFFMEKGLKPSEGLRWAARTAAEHGHLETLQWLWENGLCDHFRAGGGLVRGAAQGGQLEVLQWIEDYGLCIVEGGAWSTRLAAQRGNSAVVQWLFQHGTNRMNMAEHGASALRGAVAGGHLDLLIWLAGQEGCPDLHQNGTALVWAACEGGHLEVLQWLCKHGVQTRQGGGAALWAAARGGHLEILQWMDSNGVPAKEGGTALVRAAVKGGYLAMLVWLSEKGLDVSDGGSFCGPKTAAEKGHLDVLIWLVEMGMQLSQVGSSLTIGAAKGGQMMVLNWLADEGVTMRPYSKKAVQEAAAGGHMDTLQWLRANHVKVSSGGWEAIQAAAVGGFLEVLCWLHSNGLSIKEHGGAAIAGAAKGGHINILMWLQSQEVDLALFTREAVQEASAYGHIDILAWLKNEGFDVRDGGRKAICRAAEGGHLDALKWLVQEGGMNLQEHWRAAVWAASEAVQPDVHYWLLLEERMEHTTSCERKKVARACTPREIEMPVSKDDSVKAPKKGARLSLAIGTMNTSTNIAGHVPSTHSGDTLSTSSPTGGRHGHDLVQNGGNGLKWMLQYALDPSEGIYDELTQCATRGHMEILEWIATITEPRWTVKLAITNGHLGCLQWIVANGLDLKSVEEHAIRWAAEVGCVDMLLWLHSMGLRLNVATIEAAASRGKGTVLEVLRHFELPLSQHPTLAEELLPFLSNVTPTLLANLIVVPGAAAEAALEHILVESQVSDHRGRRIRRATMQASLHATAFSHTPHYLELQSALAPNSRTFYDRRPSQDVPVKFFHLRVHGAISPVVLRALSVTSRLPVYSTLAAQAIVLAAWHQVRAVYIVDVLLDFLQLLAVCYITTLAKPHADLSSEYSDTKELVKGSRVTVVCATLLIVVWARAVVGDFVQIMVYNRRGWGWDLMSPSEAWEWLCNLVMGVFLVTMFLGSPNWVTSPLLSFVGFTCWWKVLYSLRGFDYFGQRILPILGAFREILPFTLVMIFYGGALAHAFYALTDGELPEVIANFYRLGVIGEMDVEDQMWGTGTSEAPVWWMKLQQLWFVAASFLFTVALMNIFIAIMSSAFDRQEEKSDAEFLRTRAGLCLGYAICFEGLHTLRWWGKLMTPRLPAQAKETNLSHHHHLTDVYEFEGEDLVWLCHKDVPRSDFEKARSVRQMLGMASDLLIQETDQRLQAHEKTICATIQDQLRQHRERLSMDLLNAGVPIATPFETPLQPPKSWQRGSSDN